MSLKSSGGEKSLNGEEDDVALLEMVERRKKDEEVRESAHAIELQYKRSQRKMRHSRIKREVRETNPQCIEWLKDDSDWVPVEYGGDPRVQLFEQTLSNGAYLIKSRGPVKYWDAWSFAYKNMDTNHISRTAWDTDIAEIRNVETIARAKELGAIPSEIGAQNMPGKIEVIWYKVAVPPVASAVGIWPRDFCCWQYWALKKDGSILITSKSTFHELKGNPDEGCVRGETTCTMYITPLEQEDPDDQEEPRIYVTMVGYVKPNGMIPAQTISWYKHRMAERIEFFSNVYGRVPF